jgi:hypothetical protein
MTINTAAATQQAQNDFFFQNLHEEKKRKVFLIDTRIVNILRTISTRSNNALYFFPFEKEVILVILDYLESEENKLFFKKLIEQQPFVYMEVRSKKKTYKHS